MKVENSTVDPLFDERYRAICARDARFDGQFFTAVTSTGIYCRPSCPARTPKASNVRFYLTSAAAHEAGFRACKRCLPDATADSPQWNIRGDLAGRAMRLISDGVVDREGVEGLAERLGYTTRHIHRLLTSELGAGPQALSRARRAQSARTLLTGTNLSMSDVAFAAGFGSVRQFNETIAEVYGLSPRELRAKALRVEAHERVGTDRVHVSIELPVRHPFDARGVFEFLAPRAVPGVESVSVDDAANLRYARTLLLPHGPAAVEIRASATPAFGTTTASREDKSNFPRRVVEASQGNSANLASRKGLAGATTGAGHANSTARAHPVSLAVQARPAIRTGQANPAAQAGVASSTSPAAERWKVTANLELSSLADVVPAVARIRRLLDLDSDPLAVDSALMADPVLAPLVTETPGIRVPGAVDPEELVVRTLVGQQISVRAATAHLARLTELLGSPYSSSIEGLAALFPTSQQIANGLKDPTPANPSPANPNPANPNPANPNPANPNPANPNPANPNPANPNPANPKTRIPAGDPDRPLRLPAQSVDAIRTVTRAMARRKLRIHAGMDTEQLRSLLMEQPRIGPWSASYIAMRMLGDPDIWTFGDAALLSGAKSLGMVDQVASSRMGQRILAERANAWAPWRSYAAMHVWRVAAKAARSGTGEGSAPVFTAPRAESTAAGPQSSTGRASSAASRAESTDSGFRTTTEESHQ